MRVAAKRRIRGQEALLWVVLLLAVFNFTPSLFKQTDLTTDPLWTKALKDGPVIALLAVALFAPSAKRGTSFHPGNRWPSWQLRGARTALQTRLVRAGHPRTVMLLALFALGLFMLLDAAVRGPSGLGLLTSARYYVVYPMLVWVVLRLDLAEAEIRRLLVGVVLLGAFEGMVAFADFLGAFGATFYAGYVRIGDYLYPRAIGTLGNPNNLGLFLAFPAILLVSGVVFSGSRRLWLLLPILLGMALTFSKAVVLAFAIAVVTSPGVLMTRRGRIRAVVLVAGSVGVAYLAVSLRSGGDIGPYWIFGSRLDTASNALHQWTSSLQSFFFGSGFGSQIDEAGARGITETVMDNMALALAVEGGLVGMVIFGALVAAAFLTVSRARRLIGSPLTVALYGYSLFFLLYTPFAVNFRFFPGAMLFWLGVGLAAAATATAETRDRQVPGRLSAYPAARSDLLGAHTAFGDAPRESPSHPG